MTKTIRQEFNKRAKLEMFQRAGGPENLRCEGCGSPLRGKLFEYDHVIECWEMREKRALTAEDGKLLGYCCHKPKTAQKAAERAHGNRIIEGNARAKSKQGKSMPFGRNSNLKRCMDGTVRNRETGEIIG